MKINIQNLESIEYAELEFPVGVTILKGPNGSGKSAVFRAIEDLALNPAGVSQEIKHGTNQCSVTVENNNNSVTWQRTKSSSAYIDNKSGKDWQKASKLDSRDIADLGFYIDEDDDLVNLHDMWSTIFPFDRSDSEMFKLFEDILNISCSAQVIDEIKGCIQKKKQELTDLITREREVKDRLNIIDGILTKYDDVELDNLKELLTDKTNRLTEITNDYNTYSQKKQYSQIKLPEEYDINSIYKVETALNNLKDDYERYQKQSNLKNIEVSQISIDLSNISHPEELETDYQKYCVNKGYLKNESQNLKSLEKEIKEIQQKIDKIKVCPTCGRPLED